MSTRPLFSPALGRWCLNGFVGLVLIFLLLPTLLVIPMSLGEASYIQFPPRGLTFRCSSVAIVLRPTQSIMWLKRSARASRPLR